MTPSLSESEELLKSCTNKMSWHSCPLCLYLSLHLNSLFPGCMTCLTKRCLCWMVIVVVVHVLLCCNLLLTLFLDCLLRTNSTVNAFFFSCHDKLWFLLISSRSFSVFVRALSNPCPLFLLLLCCCFSLLLLLVLCMLCIVLRPGLS